MLAIVLVPESWARALTVNRQCILNISYPCMVIFSSCRKVFEKSHAVWPYHSFCCLLPASLTEQNKHCHYWADLWNTEYTDFWMLYTLKMSSLGCSGSFFAQAAPGEGKALFFFFFKSATHTKTAKENHSLHDKKGHRAGWIKGSAVSKRKEGWLSLQLGKT